MESDEEDVINRQDSDSGEDSDCSWSSSYDRAAQDLLDSDSDSEVLEPIDLDLDLGERGVDKNNEARRGRGRHRGNFDWEYLKELETEDAAEWHLRFDNSSSGIANLDLDTVANFEPVDFFQLFFPLEAIDLMRDETNHYGDDFVLNADITPKSRKKKWSHVDDIELNAFLALQISMGMCNKAAETDHWQTLFWINVTPYGKVLSRNRYQLISSFLHFCNNDERIPRGQDGHDSLFKIKRLFEIAFPLYTRYFSPTQQLSIDESMVAFKGRIFFRQYLPAKPTRFGIKLFILADANTHYCLKAKVYTGKTDFEIRPGRGLGDSVVQDLLTGFENKGHDLYCDNFYTSVPLFESLAEEQIGAVGTIRENRKYFPQGLKSKNKKMKKGDEPAYARCGKLLAATLQDTKRVNFLSTIHNNTNVNKRIRSKAEASGYRVLCKRVAGEDYNRYMGGVDQFDQVSGYYSFPYKCQKWYLTLFHFIVETALVNGYILFKLTHPNSKLSSKRFREEVCLKLAQPQVQRRAISLPREPRTVAGSTRAEPDRINTPHYPSKQDNEKYKPDCKVCKSIKVRTQTRFYCHPCNTPLCPHPCFGLFHTKTNYQHKRQQIHDEQPQQPYKKRARRE